MNNSIKRRPDIIDNRDIKLLDTLNLNIPEIEFFNVSTGYFYVDGYSLIQQELEKAITKKSFKFKLLVGQGTIKPKIHNSFEDYKIIATSALENESMKDMLDKQELNTDGMNATSSLINLLRSDNVQVRHNNNRFNHSKCYILGDRNAAIVGSSNFTRSGLQGNDELNVGVYQPASLTKIEEWFERMWKKSKDAKDDMISVLEQSKFGIPPTPYEIYMKMLFEKHKPLLLAIKETDSSKFVNLAKFQKDAVTAAIQIISRYNGVIIADSTGLGKTHIGLELIRQKIFVENQNVLLIAPSQVLATVWNDKLDDARVRVTTITMESLGRESFENELHKYGKFNTIVIDESQNFRSKTASRRENLMKLMTFGKKKQAILLSATPINNSIMDLYYQLSIITKLDDGYFADIGIPNLYKHMLKAANDGITHGIDKIQHLLDEIMVRRTRSFIKEMYPKETLNGKVVKFPKHNYSEIRYSITGLFETVYDDLLETIANLNMVPYGIERYNNTSSPEEKKKHIGLAQLQIILLLKRFESSTHAVKVSLDNKIQLYEYFKTILEKGQIVKTRELNKIINKWNLKEDDSEYNEDDQDQFILDELKKISTQSASNYDIAKMNDDIDIDLKLLKKYQEDIKQILPFDKKFDAVAEMLLTDKALEKESKKVLIFTEYTTTAKHLHEKLVTQFPSKTVALITGSVKKLERQKLIKRFSPNSNLAEDDPRPTDPIDILVSTEVLSEGQNLQDCNYVINYDLPWNPMRIVQRMGRIDRLTSKYDTIHSRECFPDEKLGALLQLIGKLLEKIGTINETVGLDISVLGIEPSPKQFNSTVTARIKAIAGLGGSVEQTMTQIERESDMMPSISPINEINQHIKKTGFERMLEVPMGRRSGKKDSQNVVILAYLHEQSNRTFHIVSFDYGTKKVNVLDDNEGFNLARCDPDASKHLPMDDNTHAESFRQLLKIDTLARKAIVEKIDQDYSLADEGRQLHKNSYTKTIEKIQQIITDAVGEGRVSKEVGRSVYKITEVPSMRVWENKISNILDDYNDDGNINNMATELDKVAKHMGAHDNSSKDDDSVKPTESDLSLVAAMFVTNDNYNTKTNLDVYSS